MAARGVVPSGLHLMVDLTVTQKKQGESLCHEAFAALCGAPLRKHEFQLVNVWPYTIGII
jgi:hypothetical protein